MEDYSALPRIEKHLQLKLATCKGFARDFWTVSDMQSVVIFSGCVVQILTL